MSVRVSAVYSILDSLEAMTFRLSGTKSMVQEVQEVQEVRDGRWDGRRTQMGTQLVVTHVSTGAVMPQTVRDLHQKSSRLTCSRV